MTSERERELTYAEWSRLPHRTKRSIIQGQWDPSRPERGEATRGFILEAFESAHPGLLERAVAGTAFFSGTGWSIAVVVADLAVRVPKRFDIFPVVKGMARDAKDPWVEVEWVSR